MTRKSNTPRRKRMKRHARLQAAKHWLATYKGKNVLQGYKKWFAVDLRCALKELEMLGVKFDPTRVQDWLVSDDQRLATAQRQRQERKAKQARDLYLHGVYGEDQDEHFAFIAGHTSGGFAFGMTWEESEELEAAHLQTPTDDPKDGSEHEL